MRLPECALALLLLIAAGVAGADPVDLKPFRATYTAEWKGITAANSTVELKASGPDTYVYSSVNTARGLFRMAFPDALTQTSNFRIVDGRVVPMTFKGIDEKDRPIDLTFDWQKKRVTGVAKEKTVDLEIPVGTQDAMSLQIASLRDLASGNLHGGAWMIEGNKLKDYELRLEGNARIETELGEFDTVIYVSRRPNSDRFTRTWVAPALGYLPVRAESIRGKKTEVTLLLQSVDR
ncbi:MAG TPA: DUF3108 domain-containing protein [Steroidobacteraceae bacterium]|jgi:hypothetical protein|nr:DUF3108 domain-containing protein [Steroidobacteraceae bacterium]